MNKRVFAGISGDYAKLERSRTLRAPAPCNGAHSGQRDLVKGTGTFRDELIPSIHPATHSPEPGNLFYYDTPDFLKQVSRDENVAVFDSVVLCTDQATGASEFLAAKLFYTVLSYKFAAKTGDFDEVVKTNSFSRNIYSNFNDDHHE